MMKQMKVGALGALAVFQVLGGVALLVLVAHDVMAGRFKTTLDVAMAVLSGGALGTLAIVSSMFYAVLARHNMM